jgi:hypothetical protein
MLYAVAWWCVWIKTSMDAHRRHIGAFKESKYFMIDCVWWSLNYEKYICCLGELYKKKVNSTSLI